MKKFTPTKCDSCEHIAESKTNFYFHRSTCPIRMSDHTKHIGFDNLKRLIEKPRKKFVEGVYIGLKPDEQLQLRGCISIFEEERARARLRLQELDSKAETIKLIKTYINTVNEEESDDSPPDASNISLDDNGPDSEERKRKLGEISTAPRNSFGLSTIAGMLGGGGGKSNA